MVWFGQGSLEGKEDFELEASDAETPELEMPELELSTSATSELRQYQLEGAEFVASTSEISEISATSELRQYQLEGAAAAMEQSLPLALRSGAKSVLGRRGDFGPRRISILGRLGDFGPRRIWSSAASAISVLGEFGPRPPRRFRSRAPTRAEPSPPAQSAPHLTNSLLPTT